MSVNYIQRVITIAIGYWLLSESNENYTIINKNVYQNKFVRQNGFLMQNSLFSAHFPTDLAKIAFLSLTKYLWDESNRYYVDSDRDL